MAKSGKCNKKEKSDEREDEDASGNWPAALTFRFSFGELANATNNFSKKLEKADIYSFGVMLVEIVSGKRSRELTEFRLFSVLQMKAEEGRLADLLDSRLEDEADVVKEEATKMLGVGMLCIQDDFMSRPVMSSVVRILEGTAELGSFPFSSSTASDHSVPLLSELSYTAESSTLAGR
ncbi:hypothetical protein SUGI_0718580 [Cryptomeria japonica]|nr:hypothetical protein SUGI_0718580 [Cryptomeria japonica]